MRFSGADYYSSTVSCDRFSCLISFGFVRLLLSMNCGNSRIMLLNISLCMNLNVRGVKVID